MRNHNKKIQAMTLTEILVVMSVMVILLAIAAPVARKLAQSLGESTGTRSIVSAAMANARAIAIREQKYAGVRFGQDSSGKQYLVLIIHDPAGTNLANGFRVVEGRKPMALPEKIGVIAGGTYTDASLGTVAGMTNATTFSVIFSQAGKFVIHPVQVRNKDGKIDTVSPPSTDKVFNVQSQVTSDYAMFIQDDYVSLGLAKENSVPSFIIYEKKELDKVAASLRWSGYFSMLDKEFVNPYTGELVKK
jgi:prepilin-type N-terminal cleavage/methylation domain-containing protein